MLNRSLQLFLVAVSLAVFASQPAQAHEGTHEGKIVKAGEGKLTFAVAQKEKEKQSTRTMNVAANATIMLDEKPAKLEDLKEGFHATVTNDAKHVVTKIVAHSKEHAPK